MTANGAYLAGCVGPGVAGLVAGTLWVVGQMAYDAAPELGTADASEIARFYAENAATHRAGVTLAGVVFILFLWYLGWLRAALSQAEGEQSVLSTVAFAAGIDRPLSAKSPR